MELPGVVGIFVSIWGRKGFWCLGFLFWRAEAVRVAGAVGRSDRGNFSGISWPDEGVAIGPQSCYCDVCYDARQIRPLCYICDAYARYRCTELR